MNHLEGLRVENTINGIYKNNEIMRKTKMTDGKLTLVRVEEKTIDEKYYKHYMVMWYSPLYSINMFYCH